MVLLHGLGRGPGSMRVMAWQLRRAGFQSLRIGYAATRQGLTASEAQIRRALAGLGPVDLVGHSLGGLMASRIKRDPQGLQIGRVVQLGTPNRGTPMADRLGGLAPVRRMCGPVPAELNGALRPQPPNAEIAAIAGTAGCRLLKLPRPHDGLVPVRSAWDGARHRAAVMTLHTLLPISPGALRKTVEFLTHGEFREPR